MFVYYGNDAISLRNMSFEKYDNIIVELFPVGLATGTTPMAADASYAGPHSTTRSNNTFMRAPFGGVYDGPDGQGCRHRSPRCAAVRWNPPWMHPFGSFPSKSSFKQIVSIFNVYCTQKLQQH